MSWRLNYLAIAVVLTLLDTVVAVYYGTAVWAAWSGDILARGLLALFAAVGATSLANIWVQARYRLRAGHESTVPRPKPVTIPAELRGKTNV